MKKTDIFTAVLMAAAVAMSSLTYAAEAEESADHVQTVDAPGWVSCGVYKTTGYCPCRRCCGENADGITASGTHATQGRTVAAGREFPFGTQIMLNGHIYAVEDRGVKNGHIDVFYADHETAWNHGVQYVEVFVKEE